MIVTRATIKKNKNKKGNPQPRKKQGPTIVGQALREVGAMMGSRWGPVGASAGRLAGAAISKITGQGDYKVRSNAIMTDSTQAPSFTVGRDNVTTIVHRELIQDVVSPGATFTNSTFNINAGNAALFPWLAPIAARYQKYRFRGLVFEFKSSSSEYATGAALGVVVMATNYNSVDAPYTTKVAMENSSFACSDKPSVTFYHPVECAAGLNSQPWWFTRDYVNPISAQQLYDVGTFQLATSGLSAPASTVIGELWATYIVDVVEPVIPPALSLPGDAYFDNSYTLALSGFAQGPFMINATDSIGHAFTGVPIGASASIASIVNSVGSAPLVGTFQPSVVFLPFVNSNARTSTAGTSSIAFNRAGVYTISCQFGGTSAAILASPWAVTTSGAVTVTQSYYSTSTVNEFGLLLTFTVASLPLSGAVPSVTFTTGSIATFGTYASLISIVQ